MSENSVNQSIGLTQMKPKRENPDHRPGDVIVTIPGRAGNANDSVFEHLRQLSGQGFWGAVTVRFQAGQIVHITKEESMKPSQLAGPEHRSKHERTTS
jgi:hypothetical protein